MAEVAKNEKRMRPRSVQGSHRKVSWDFGPSSESFSLAYWVLWGLLVKFHKDLACQKKLLLHVV